MEAPKDTALIFTNRLLPYSETFIQAHGSNFRTYKPHFVGCRRIDELDLSPNPVSVVNEGGLRGSLRELRFKLTGRDKAFVAALHSLHPALLHAHFGGCAAIALPLAEALDLPYIVTFHGIDATRSVADRRKNLSLTAQLYLHRLDDLKERADRVLTVTHYMREMVVAQGFPEEKVSVHPLGIDTDHFAPDPTVEREPIVLFVGRLVEKKGGTYLIQAMETVQRKLPEAELVVIGDGPLRTSLEDQARRTLRRVRFLGRQAPDQVRYWMRRASVFSVPSVIASSGDREGFGIVFLEAQAVGTPVVSFASGGIPEAVADGETGILAPERDVDALGRALLDLLTDQTQWDVFSERGIERVRRMFDAREQARKLENLYDEIRLRRPGRARRSKALGVFQSADS